MTATKISRQRTPAGPNHGDMQLGALLRDDGTLTELDIKDILAAQLVCRERFGEVASRLGLANEQDVRRALARQAEFPLAIAGESALNPALIAAFQPDSARAEELRTLRSELVLRWFGRGNRLLAVIEPRLGSGCSVLAANLAVTFAQLGERTLLIDANLRQPAQHTLFGIKPDFGLSDFIKGRQNLENVITKVPGFSSLSVMCAGALPPNPQELLGSVSFGYMMETAPGAYDVVVLDTPPALQCADAQLIAARARGAVLTTRRHNTRLADVMRVKAQLESADVNLVGAVLDG
jgi:protein-tyrosine kinase